MRYFIITTLWLFLILNQIYSKLKRIEHNTAAHFCYSIFPDVYGHEYEKCLWDMKFRD